MHLVSAGLPAVLLLLSTFALTTLAEDDKELVRNLDIRPACAGAEFRQFDFFAGDWDTYDVADSTKIVARNQVTIILDGCVLREVYRQNDGLVGESFSLYDGARAQWHQSWVTNRGALLLLNGGLEGDRMVLTGTERAKDGSSALLRGIWRREGAGVRETAERSADSGKTWTPVFDILFRKHTRQGKA